MSAKIRVPISNDWCFEVRLASVTWTSYAWTPANWDKTDLKYDRERQCIVRYIRSHLTYASENKIRANMRARTPLHRSRKRSELYASENTRSPCVYVLYRTSKGIWSMYIETYVWLKLLLKSPLRVVVQHWDTQKIHQDSHDRKVMNVQRRILPDLSLCVLRNIVKWRETDIHGKNESRYIMKEKLFYQRFHVLPLFPKSLPSLRKKGHLIRVTM